MLSASRYQTVVDELRALIEGRYGSPPGPIDATVKRAVTLSGGAPEEEAPVDLDSLRAEAEGLASSEEELLLLALFGEEAEPLLQSIRGRASGDESLSAGGVDQARAERIREIVRIVQESGVGEVTIEEAGMRVSVRRTPEQLEPSSGRRLGTARRRTVSCRRPRRRRPTASRASRRRWSASSTARRSRARRRSSRRATRSRRARRSASSRR